MFSKYSVRRGLCVLGFAAAIHSAAGQNLHNPNKLGPVNTQINSFSGNLFLPRLDFSIPARGFDLRILFCYNSFNFDIDQGYGKGWSFFYDMRCRPDSANGRTIIWGDGREDSYTAKTDGSFTAPRGFFDKLEQYTANKFRLREKNGTQYFFENDIHKRVTKMQDPNGNFINLSYTDTLLTSIAGSSGQTINLTYDNSGRLSRVTDAISTPTRIYQYAYDNTGNLKSVTDPAGGKHEYLYLVNGPIKKISDKNHNSVDVIYFPDFSVSEVVGCNKRVSFSYDTTSKTTIVTDYLAAGSQVTKYVYNQLENLVWLKSKSGNCCGSNMSFEYDEQGNVLEETDNNGNKTHYTYDLRGNMLTMTDPLQKVYTYTYSEDFNLIKSYIDPKGNVYLMSYNSTGDMLSITEPDGAVYTAAYNTQGDLVSSTDPKGNIFTYNYNALGQPVSVTGPGGYSAALVHDARGNLLSVTDARGFTHNAEYDILNRLKKIIDPAAAAIQMTYDAESNVVTFTNKAGQVSTFGYDASNRLVKIADALGTGAEFGYDEVDNVLFSKNAAGNTLRFAYDARNRVTSAELPLGARISYQYDANGNRTSTNVPTGQRRNYTYDAMDRLLSISDSSGSIGSFSYDANGNITTFTNANNARTAFTFDEKNRISSVTDPLGKSLQYTYDLNGNIISRRDRSGLVSTSAYDGLNREITRTDQNGKSINFIYDAQSQITGIRDQNNNLTGYEYDNQGRLTKTTFPDGKYIQLGYDAKDNVVTKRKPDGTIINFTYDAYNRVITKLLPGIAPYTYTYDQLGRMTTASNSAGIIVIAYDALNRIVSETFNGRMVTYGYDIAGRTQTTIYPDGSTATRKFDQRNRLINVYRNNVEIVRYSYDPGNNQLSKRLGNGIAFSMDYDVSGRLTGMNGAGAHLQQSSFSYNFEGKKIAATRTDNSNFSEQFVYDNEYRLTGYKQGPTGSPITTSQYNYDGVGNRVSLIENGSTTNYTNNNLNQLTGRSGAQTASFVYDDNGNITFDGTWFKQYDAENKLVKDSAAPGRVQRYIYDAFGRRVQTIIGGSLSNFVYSGAAPIEKRDAAGNLIVKTFYSDFLRPITNETNTGTYYYHTNELGSIEGLSDSLGRVVERYGYDVYGKTVRRDTLDNPLLFSPSKNIFGFTGQEYDSATKSYRFFFRNYSPETGVFNQRDPLQYEDGMGMYQYVGNDPGNGVDVWGLEDCETPYKNTDIGFGVSFISEWGNVGGDEIHRRLVKRYNNKLDDAINMEWTKAEQNRLNKGKQPKTENGRNRRNAFNDAFDADANAKAFRENADKFGKGMNLIDNAVTGEAMASSFADGQSNEQWTQETQATGDFALSLLGWTPVGAAYGTLDMFVEGLTGDPLTQHSADLGNYLGENSVTSGTDIENAAWDYAASTGKGRGRDWLRAKEKVERRQREWRENNRKSNCPEGGTRRIRYKRDPKTGLMVIVWPIDPNEIIGPKGEPGKAWVSVKDRMPYTVLFENDSSASAPAKIVRVTTPIEAKQDAVTFELGSFGFNNQSFDIPPGTSSYYNRLDVRDSLNLFVDITAGYDQINNRAFWEFQSINPITLLPSEEPLEGFLKLQDTLNPEYGNGFVNFSIKPKQTAVTLDTISAKAEIIFDGNEAIGTNIHKNTIDAFAPTSGMATLPATSNNPVALSWSGADDANGCGIRFFTLYVATDGVNFSVFQSRTARRDTTFIGQPGLTYSFFVLATDSVGNVEAFGPGKIRSTFIGAIVPVTWLSFTGKTVNKDNVLDWATASEQNSRDFNVERSFNGINFTSIGTVRAAGNSNTRKDYQFKDRNIDLLKSPVFYYRIKQNDNSGGSRLSNIVKLTYTVKDVPNSIVYPNPTRGMITVAIGDRSLIGSTAQLYDEAGRMIQTIKITSANVQLNMEQHQNGTYFLRLNNKEVMRIVKL